MTPALPKINWIKNDPDKHQWFEDGSVFLVALRVKNNKTKIEKWEFDMVAANCDGEGMSLHYRQGEPYDAWTWPDFEYFTVVEGQEPIKKPDGEE